MHHFLGRSCSGVQQTPALLSLGRLDRVFGVNYQVQRINMVVWKCCSYSIPLSDADDPHGDILVRQPKVKRYDADTRPRGL